MALAGLFVIAFVVNLLRKKTFVLMALIKLLHLFTIFSSNENAMKLLFMAYAEKERGGRTDFTEEELVSNIFSVWLIFGLNCFLA